jgi:ribosomal protein S18 acetylase RimI-like enzyme
MKVQNIELKTAQLNDAKQIALMSRKYIEFGLPWTWNTKRVVRHIRRHDCVVLKACSEKQIIGFAIMQFFDKNAHLSLLAVEPTYQHLGVGRSLIEWLEKTALTGGIFFVKSEVRAGNINARAFYRKLGYRETRYISGYYCGQEDGIRLIHDLSCKHSLSTPYDPTVQAETILKRLGLARNSI